MQVELFDKSDAGKRFERFHAENPHIYRHIVQACRKLKERGWRHYSVRAIWNVIRFRYDVQTTAHDFKLNDHYTPFYARLIMKNEVDLVGFFEIRRAKADRDIGELEMSPSPPSA